MYLPIGALRTLAFLVRNSTAAADSSQVWTLAVFATACYIIYTMYFTEAGQSGAVQVPARASQRGSPGVARPWRVTDLTRLVLGCIEAKFCN